VSDAWTWRPLGQLFEIGAGKTMSAAARAGADKVPFLRTSNVFWDRLDLSAVDEMSIPAHELPYKLVEPGDLLVCEGGEIGRAAIWDGSVSPMAFQNHLHRLRPRTDDVEPRFYVFFLQAAFTQLGIFEGAGNKTTIPNLSSGRLAALEVPHPPLAEQQAIAATLGLIRRASVTQDAQVGLARELRAAAMARLLTKGLRDAEKRDSDIGPVPEHWTVGPVGDFAEFQRGFDITKKMQVAAGDIPVVSSGGIRSYHDVAAAEGPGVVIGRKGSIGSLHYVATDYWPHDTTLWCRDFKGNLPKFVYYRLHLVDMKRLDSGATNPALNRNFLHDELISWPPVDEQKEIVAVVESIERKIGLHETKLGLLSDLFGRMLHDLMTGSISIDDLVVPASATSEGSAA
jgi:type I restriction enzyme S subunit